MTGNNTDESTKMKHVDWTKWSAVAEIVSSIAILVTLGYLAIQTSQNTQACIRQSMLTDEREMLFKQMDYPFVSRLTGMSEWN